MGRFSNGRGKIHLNKSHTSDMRVGDLIECPICNGTMVKVSTSNILTAFCRNCHIEVNEHHLTKVKEIIRCKRQVEKTYEDLINLQRALVNLKRDLLDGCQPSSKSFQSIVKPKSLPTPKRISHMSARNNKNIEIIACGASIIVATHAFVNMLPFLWKEVLGVAISYLIGGTLVGLALGLTYVAIKKSGGLRWSLHKVNSGD